MNYAMLCLGYDVGLSRQAFIVMGLCSVCFNGMIVIPQYKGVDNAMLSLRIILLVSIFIFTVSCSIANNRRCCVFCLGFQVTIVTLVVDFREDQLRE